MEQPLTKEMEKEMIRAAIQQNESQNKFALSEVAFHTHNGSEAPRININELSTIYLPTSSTGLASGTLWNSSNTIKIVP